MSNAIDYFKDVGETVGNTVKKVGPAVVTGIPGINTMYNFGTSVIRESDYEIIIDNVLNIKMPTVDNIEKAKLTINTIMFNEKDNKVMIEKLNKFITNFLINWNKNPNNKRHWYESYLEEDIKQKTDELDKLYKKFKETTADNLKDNVKEELLQELAKFSRKFAGLDFSVLGLEDPTNYDELMKLDGSGLLDTVGAIFSDVFSGGKKNKK